jgi:hypothetical protein
MICPFGYARTLHSLLRLWTPPYNDSMSIVFRTIVKGFKEMFNDIGPENIVDYRQCVSRIWKNYLSHKSKGSDFTSKEIRNEIKEIRNEIKNETMDLESYNSSIFDRAFSCATDFLKHRCHPNFVKSAIFIEYLQQKQCNEEQQKMEEAEAVIIKEPLQAAEKNIVESEEKKPQLPPKNIINRQQQQQQQQQNNGGTLKLPNLQSVPENRAASGRNNIIINEFNPWAEADAVRKQNQINGQPTAAAAAALRNPGNLAYIPEHDQRSSRSGSNTLQRKSQRPKRNNGSSTTYDMGPIDAMLPNHHHPGDRPGAPYHAKSSTINNVSRINSAVQSDAYSTFSTDSKQHEERKKVKNLMTASNNNDGLQSLGHNLHLNKKHLINNKWIAEVNQQAFIDLLIPKLNQIHEQDKSNRQWKEFLKQHRHERMSNPSQSVVELDVDETDEVIIFLKFGIDFITMYSYYNRTHFLFIPGYICHLCVYRGT